MEFLKKIGISKSMCSTLQEQAVLKTAPNGYVNSVFFLSTIINNKV